MTRPEFEPQSPGPLANTLPLTKKTITYVHRTVRGSSEKFRG